MPFESCLQTQAGAYLFCSWQTSQALLAAVLDSAAVDLQDVSFWLPEAGFTENNLCEVVRSQAGDLVEAVELTDAFTNPKTQKQSNCFRVTYRSMERSLTDQEINDLQVRPR